MILCTEFNKFIWRKKGYGVKRNTGIFYAYIKEWLFVKIQRYNIYWVSSKIIFRTLY